MRSLVLYTIIACCFAALGQSALSEDRVPTPAQPGKDEYLPLRFQVKGIGRTELTTVYHDQKVYVPVVSMFTYLIIRADYDSIAGIVSGYYVSPDSAYRIDGKQQVVVYHGQRTPLAETDYFMTSRDFYLSMDVAKRLFNLNLSFQKSSLTLKLVPSPDLPILAAARRERTRLRMLRKQDPKYVTKSVDPGISLFNAGALDWRLISDLRETGTPRHSYFFREGMEVLGGTFVGMATGDFGKSLTRSRLRGTQTYTFFKSPALSQIVLGDMTPVTGAFRENLFGAEITNRPAARHVYFADELFQEQARLEQSADVYLNGQLLPSGGFFRGPLYNRALPLRYGSNDVEFHMYDRWLNETVFAYRPFVPTTMMRPDEFRYSLSAGKLRLFNDTWYGNGNVQYGLSDRVTVGGLVESFEYQSERKLYPALTGTGRVTQEIVLDMFYSPLATSRTTLSYLTPSLAGLNISYSLFARNTQLNLRDAHSEIIANGQIPIFFKRSQAAFINLGYDQTDYYQGRERSATAGLSLYLRNFQPRITAGLFWSNRGTTTDSLVTFRLTPGARFRLPLDIVIDVQADYEQVSKKFEDVIFQATKSITSEFLLAFAYNRFLEGPANVNLQLTMNLPFLTSSTIVNRVQSENSYQEHLSGSVAFSTESGEFSYDRVANKVGFGEIVLNPFVDANYNGVYDQGEQIVRMKRVRGFTEAGEVTTSNELTDQYRLDRMQAYQLYRLYMDPEGFENPLWVPEYSSFSMRAYPDRIQRFDIPIVDGGVVRGAVYEVTKEGNSPIEGVPVTIQSVDSMAQDGMRIPKYLKTMNSFSTGEFEFYPILPGQYTIRIDRDAVTRAGYRTVTYEKAIEIKHVAGGDVVEGVNFALTR